MNRPNVLYNVASMRVVFILLKFRASYFIYFQLAQFIKHKYKKMLDSNFLIHLQPYSHICRLSYTHTLIQLYFLFMQQNKRGEEKYEKEKKKLKVFSFHNHGCFSCFLFYKVKISKERDINKFKTFRNFYGSSLR